MNDLSLAPMTYRRLTQFSTGNQGQVLMIEGGADELRTQAGAAVAVALLCQEANGQACGTCPSCRYWAAGTHTDYVVLPGDVDAKIIPVDDVRTRVMSDSVLAPQLGAVKVYQLNGDKLNEQGQNALLKTLEEPPAACYFILTVEKADHLLGTLQSRAVVVALRQETEQVAELGLLNPEDLALAEEILDWQLKLPALRVSDALVQGKALMDQVRGTPEVFYLAAMGGLRDLAVVLGTLASGNAEDLLLVHPKAAARYRDYVMQFKPQMETIYTQNKQLELWLKRLRGNANFDMACQAFILAWWKEHAHG